MTREQRSDIFFALFFALALYVAWVLRRALLLVFVAAMLAVIFGPAIEAVQRIRIRGRHPSRGASILILLALFFVVIGLIGFFAVPPLLREAKLLVQEWPQRVNEMTARLHKLPIAGKIDAHEIDQSVKAMMAAAIKVFDNMGRAAAGLLTLAIMTGYFMLDGERAFRWLISFCPLGNRERLAMTLARAEHRISKWIFGQMLLMLILACADAVVYGIMGIEFFYVLAVFAGLANFIPIIGPIIGLIPAVLVAATQSVPKLIGVLIFYGIYQQVDNSYLTPRVMRATVDISPLAVVVALIVGAELAGVLGALVAVPTAALVEVLAQEYLVRDPEFASI
jgi:predicted PurR-regulated permease PerM